MSSADLHAFGRDALLEAWPLVTGREASVPELQIAGAVANFESGYGTFPFKNLATGEVHRNTNNWGAVQCGHGPPCGSDCFEATDTSPAKVSADNPRGQYQACFKRPATAAEGAVRFVREITIRRPTSWGAMLAGDIDAFSAAMRHRDPETGVGIYYEGFGATVADQINNHAHAVETGVNEIAQKLGEPIMARRGGPATGGDDGGLDDALACSSALVLLYFVKDFLLRKIGL